MKKIKYLFFLLLYFFIFLSKCKKNKRPKISIFLPIYNKEKSIKNSIFSLQKQTIRDIEIIAVNDHSSDGTLNKLKDLAKTDNRIKIINNDKNHGLLYSRAMGILHSSGEYILNLDPDDEIKDNESLEYLYNQSILSNIDIISFDVFYEKINKIVKCNYENIFLKQPKLFNSIFYANNKLRDFFIVNKLIKREIFQQAYEFFKYEIYHLKWNYFEDMIWSILVNKYSKSKLCVNKVVYIYNYNEGSLTNKKNEVIELRNLFYMHEMYKKLFNIKKYEKYLIAEYHSLFNSVNNRNYKLLITKEKSMKKYIINNFMNFINNYKSSIKKENLEKIKNFLCFIHFNEII